MEKAIGMPHHRQVFISLLHVRQGSAWFQPEDFVVPVDLIHCHQFALSIADW
jgi:hypothetical protein